MDEFVKYVCKKEDLDLLLPEPLKEKFQSLFADSWRMNYKGATPKSNLAPLGIDYDKPTVRDAVAFDLVKLDDDSVSNDSIYTYEEHLLYSPSEYERLLLNRNYRVNLVNLAKDWSVIDYAKTGTTATKRTMDKRFEGIRLSQTLMDYFVAVMDAGSADGIYVPFTNANDFSAEVSIIPNTHDNLRQITSRTYYDTKWAQYKWILNKHGITNVATFALVDLDKDKNHTGEYLVKVQRRVGNNWQYLTVVMDKDGHLKSEPVVWTTDDNSEDLAVGNTILCVCEQDFRQEREKSQEVWQPVVDDVPMVHSTTSSHYSIFRQRIPDYDLKLVRHWFQFKNRLAGMELCLEQLRRDVHHKETEVSECFAKQTMVLDRLMRSFTENQDVMDLVAEYYDLLAEWDDLMLRKLQLSEYKDGKLALLRQLQDEYNALDNSQMDKKLALGQKIASLRLELDKSIEESLKSIDDRLDEIERRMNEINEQICMLEEAKRRPYKVPDEYKDLLAEIDQGVVDSADSMLLDWAAEHMILDSTESSSSSLVSAGGSSTRPTIREVDGSDAQVDVAQTANREPPELRELDTTELHRLVLQSERWRNYILNLSWEWDQMKQMLTMCEDATIKVRRLCHNFEERMKDTQERVWDKDYNLRPDFDFKDISVDGLRSVILLHDWWAANAPGAKPEDLHMTEEQFEAFRRRCNTVSYNLRKNQYYQLLSTKIERSERRIEEIEDIIANKDTLHWDDKYGWDAPRDEGDEEWTPEMAKAASKAKVRLFAMANAVIDAQPRSAAKSDKKSSSSTAAIRSGLAKATAVLDAKAREQKQYREDSRKLVERTMDYLKNLGLVKSQADLESIATRNAANANPEVASRWIAELTAQRGKLDSTMDVMNRQRDSLKSIIGNVAKIEQQIGELQERNRRIYEQCMKVGPKAKGVQKSVRNRMLLEKVENQQKIVELKALAKKAKSQHLEDFSSLEKMRRDVDAAQASYDAKVREFKKDIGLTKEVVDNLMIGIYNKFQDEILEHNKRKHK